MSTPGESGRKALDCTTRLGPIAEALTFLPVENAYVDGDIAVLDGASSFPALQDTLSRGAAHELVYFAFDLLRLDGLDLTPLPLIERKAALKKLLGRRRRGGPIRYSDRVQGQGGRFYSHANSGWEGIVSKLARSPIGPVEPPNGSRSNACCGRKRSLGALGSP